jgi:PPK2 family polyphosphate:nucleotide phosphotransferase
LSKFLKSGARPATGPYWRNMKINPQKFLVREGESVDLRKRPTLIPPFYASKEESEALLRTKVEKLSDLQRRLYASDRFALLIILQGMDTSGKDGVIRHVMSGLNPQGCEVHSFKQPSDEELHHDFLWRAYKVLPARGRIGVFNRSYYEDVVVVRVHPEFLAMAGYDGDKLGNKAFWKARYRAMVEVERHLVQSGTRILKFMLHLSEEEQRKRLLARIDEPEKNWKIGPSDIAERSHWKEYIKAYEACLSATSTADVPWFVVPADDKQNARLIVAEIMLATLEDMDLRYPELSEKQRKELYIMRRELQKPAGSGDEPKEG